MGSRATVSSAALKRILHIGVAVSAFSFSAFTAIAPVSGNPAESRPFYLPYQYSSFADDTTLYTGAYRNAQQVTGIEGDAPGTGGGARRQDCRSGAIVAGTISHHLFIRNLIAQYFIGIARNVHPGRIILIGPNHRARGHSPIALSALRWRTPFGLVEPDSEAIRKISNTGLAVVEEEPFVNEHSIGALVPFIRRTFPGARIVPIIFKKAAHREDCAKLAGVIAGLMDSTLVLASLDFSHYRTSREAEKEDAASMDVLRRVSKDRVDQAFVDSRPALLTLLSLCRDIGALRVEVVQHTNSGILSHKPRVACTSYINTYITSPHSFVSDCR